MELSARLTHGIGAFKACRVTRNGARRPTLYSSRRITRRLPFTFSTTVLALLYFLVFYNLVSLGCAIEGVYYEWIWTVQGVVLIFALVTVPLALLVLSSLDLHKRRQRRLRPKRIIITAGITFVVLILWLSILGSCYFGLTLVGSQCRIKVREEWSIWYYATTKTDLGPILPFLASISMIFYIIYLTIGLVALARDREIERFESEAATVSNLPNQPHWLEGIKPSIKPVTKRSYRLKSMRRKPVAMLADQAHSELSVQTRYAESRPSSHVHSIPETSRSQGQDSQGNESSLWDSSVAEISINPTSTDEPSTGASNSLVTPNSVRSSAVISSASSMLPAYSERESISQSQRHSMEVQLQPVSLPEHVYLIDEILPAPG